MLFSFQCSVSKEGTAFGKSMSDSDDGRRAIHNQVTWNWRDRTALPGVTLCNASQSINVMSYETMVLQTRNNARRPLNRSIRQTRPYVNCSDGRFFCNRSKRKRISDRILLSLQSIGQVQMLPFLSVPERNDRAGH